MRITREELYRLGFYSCGGNSFGWFYAHETPNGLLRLKYNNDFGTCDLLGYKDFGDYSDSEHIRSTEELINIIKSKYQHEFTYDDTPMAGEIVTEHNDGLLIRMTK